MLYMEEKDLNVKVKPQTESQYCETCRYSKRIKEYGKPVCGNSDSTHYGELMCVWDVCTGWRKKLKKESV